MRLPRVAAAAPSGRATFAAGRGGDLAALGAGAASVLAFAPFAAWPLAVLCPALLFALWSGLGARRAAWRGFLYGAGEFLCGIYWIYIAVSGLGPGPWWLGVLLYVALALACAVFPAVVGYAAVRFAPGPGLTWLLAVPAAWTLLEWVRSFVLTGFPWLALGFSQPTSPLGGFAPLAGTYGVSFACVTAAVLVVIVFRPRRWREAIFPAAALGALFVAGFLVGRIPFTQPAGKAFSVSLVQGDIPQHEKWQGRMIKPIIRRYWLLTQRHRKSDVVVWPEAAIPIWYSEVAPAVEKMAAAVQRRGTELVFGVPIYEFGSGDSYNAVMAVGGGRSVYYKRHLVPFGEYFPVPDWIKGWLSAHSLPYSSFTPGPRVQPPLAVGQWKAAVANCYEVAFGRLLNTQLPAAQFIINASDDGWFGRSIAPAQQFQMARVAARASGRYLLAVTNSGVTGIVGPRGGLRSRLPPDQVGVLDGRVVPLAGATPYVRFGNALIVFVSLGLFVAGLVFALVRRRRG